MEDQREGSNDDTVMGTQEELPQEAAEHTKATYKSFKKKYKKLKFRFDGAMQESNSLYLAEQRAIKTARRLAQQNDQIMDFLLDVNDCAQIPSDKRIDLTAETPALAAIPALVSNEELDLASKLLSSPEAQQTYNEIQHMLKERTPTTRQHASYTAPKTLASLASSTPHLTSNNPHVPSELLDSLKPEHGQEAPYHYPTPLQVDDHLYEIDSTLGTVPTLPKPVPQPPSEELAFNHYHSPYNWLRRKVPQIFLQDGESSEKSQGKPGALRGAGKRASIPAPSKPDALEIVEEDGQGYEFSLTSQISATKKRKRGDEDDGGYHPKKGAGNEEGKAKKPRQYKRGKKSSEGVDGEKEKEKEKPASTRKKKAKAPSPPLGAHPFGDF